MKKIKFLFCFALVISLLTSCKKNKDSVNSEYAVELKTIETQPQPEKKIKSSIKKIRRGFLNLFEVSDNQIELRKNAVLANFEDNKSIKLGIASSWTKNITDAHDALILGLKEVNEKGGAAGAQIVLVEGDDMADVNTGTRVAYKLAEDKEIFAVLGHAFSDISTPASLIYSYYGMPMFSPISTSHQLTRQKDSMIFRNVPDDTEFGKAAAEFCSEKEWHNVAIIYADVAFAENIANQFELECGTLNISVVTRDSFAFQQTESEYKNLFKKWKNNYKFDSILLIGNMPQIGKIVTYLREAEINQPVIGSDSFDDPRLVELFKENEAGRIFTFSTFNNESQNPEYIEFVKKFKAAYGHEPDQEGVQWYDAFMVLTSAIEKAGKPVAADVTEVLRNNTWSKAAGPYTFDNHGNMKGKTVVVKELTADGYKIIK